MDTKSIKYFSILIAFLAVICFSTSAFAVCDVFESGDNAATPGTLRNCIEVIEDPNILLQVDVFLDSSIIITQTTSIQTDGSVQTDPFTIDGQNNDRIFEVPADGLNVYTLTLTNVILTNGNAGNGGAILVAGPHNLMIDCVEFIDNTATNNGGAIRAVDASNVDINDSTFTGNMATSNGGAISMNDNSDLIMTNSTINNNMARDGGGIHFAGMTTGDITNSTICDNDALDFGGGIYTNTDITLTHVTIANNTANFDEGVDGVGGGIATNNTGDVVTAVNTFLFNNIMVPNGGGVNVQNCGSNNTFDADSNGFSISNDATCEDITLMAIGGVLGLADNGGKTETKQVLSSSNIFEIATADCTSTDQRGEPRTPGAGPCTPGAYEPGVEVGSIQVEKSIAGSMQDFTFSFTSAPTAGLPMDTDCTPNLAGGNVNLGDTEITNCTMLPIGETYTITETVPAGFQLDTINCVPTGAPTINPDIANNRVLVTLNNDGDRAVCTFTNSEVPTQDLTVNVTDDNMTGCSFDSAPAGILNCVAGGGTCMSAFNEGEMVTISETVGGIDFTCGGGCDANCMVTIPMGMAPAACDITCTQETPMQDLEVVVSDPENVGCSFDSNPSGISNCTDTGGTCTAPFAEGSNVTIDDELIGLEFECSGDCNSNCVANIPVGDGATCNVLCTDIPSGDDDDDDDNDDNDIRAINDRVTVRGDAQAGPVADGEFVEVQVEVQCEGLGGAFNTTGLIIDLLEEDGLNIVNVFLEPGVVGSCEEVSGEGPFPLEGRSDLSFICNVPFCSAGSSFDIITDVFVSGIETEEPSGQRIITYALSSLEFNEPLLAFVSIIVKDEDTGCTLAAAGTRSFSTLSVFALIPGLVLLRIFTRRLRRKK